MLSHPELYAIGAAVLLVVGGLTVRAWLASAKLEGMQEMMRIVVTKVSPYYDDGGKFPEDLGRAFIAMRSSLSDTYFDISRIKVFSEHATIVADKMGEACVERGKRLATPAASERFG